VFALSGWDLVGALTLPQSAVRERLADGDTRWINRGSYDLLGSNAKAKQSSAGLPVAVALYGSLPKQLESSDSFASQLARMLKARAELRLYEARLVDLPKVQAKGLLVLVHELPESAGLEITVINFANAPAEDTVVIKGVAQNATALDVLDPKSPPLAIDASGTLRLKLQPYEYRALRIKR
jgi:hypothetical protein